MLVSPSPYVCVCVLVLFHEERHLASIGNPIVGDARYSEDAEDADDVDNSHHHHQGGMFLQ